MSPAPPASSDEPAHARDLDDLVLDEDFVRKASIKEKKVAAKARHRVLVRRFRRHFPAFAVVLLAVGVIVIGYQRWTGVVERREQTDAELREAIANLPAGAAVTTSTTTDELTLSSRAYQSGDCVTWNQEQEAGNRAQRRTDVVSCDQAHLFEYISSVTLRDQPAEPPTEDRRRQLINDLCGPLVGPYLGYEIDPAGRFAVGALTPTDEGWRDGDRIFKCGLQANTLEAVDLGARDVMLASFSGVVRGQDQTLLMPVGSCYRNVSEDRSAGIVPCAEPHDYQVVGTVDTNPRTDRYPSSDQAWRSAIGSRCDAVADEYTGGSAANLDVRWFEFDESSWNVGRRTVECVIATSQAIARV